MMKWSYNSNARAHAAEPRRHALWGSWRLCAGNSIVAVAVTVALGLGLALPRGSAAMPCGDVYPCTFDIREQQLQRVPSVFKFQARISQAKLPVGEAVFGHLVVRVRRGNEILCSESFSNVRVRDSVLNLEIGRRISCDLDEVVAANNDLAFQVCIEGEENCLKPIVMGTVPFAVKSSFAAQAQEAHRSDEAAVAHYAHRVTADRDLFTRHEIGTGYFDFYTYSNQGSEAGQLDNLYPGETYAPYAHGGFLQWAPVSEERPTLNICGYDIASQKPEPLGELVLFSELTTARGDAHVEGDAVVDGDLLVQQNARVIGNHTVNGQAMVMSGAEVHGGATVYDGAVIYNGAQVSSGGLVVADDEGTADDLVCIGDARTQGHQTIDGGATIASGLAVSDGATFDGGVGIYGALTAHDGASIGADLSVSGVTSLQGGLDVAAVASSAGGEAVASLTNAGVSWLSGGAAVGEAAGVNQTSLDVYSVARFHGNVSIDGELSASVPAGGVGTDQLASNAVTAAKVGFNYAGSTSKGGAASDVACSQCVGSSDVDSGAVQLRAKSICSDSQKMVGIGADGTVACMADRDSFVGVPYAAGTGVGGEATGLACTGCVGSSDVDSGAVQLRVGGACNDAQKMVGIGADGTVACGTDRDSFVGVPYAAGTGVGGEATGLACSGCVGGGDVDANAVQLRVKSKCEDAQKMVGVEADGTVSCVADKDTITTVSAGTGLKVTSAGSAYTVGLAKPILTKTYNMAKDTTFTTDIKHSEYFCFVGGLNFYDGDIYEDKVGEIMRLHTTKDGAFWKIEANFRTHNTHESHIVGLVCLPVQMIDASTSSWSF